MIIQKRIAVKFFCLFSLQNKMSEHVGEDFGRKFDELRKKFNALDVDGDGEIHARELIEVIKNYLITKTAVGEKAAEEQAIREVKVSV